MTSCTNAVGDSYEKEAQLKIKRDYYYSANEIETTHLINKYRLSQGLDSLKVIDHISYKAEEHDHYMITSKTVSHSGFEVRSENIMKVLGATTVGENIAFSFNKPSDAVNAWLRSPKHLENIVGDYTCFGISIRENPLNRKKYYTTIFAKI